MKHAAALAALILAGCTNTKVLVVKDQPDGTQQTAIDLEWGGFGDTSRTVTDCRKGSDRCFIYIETTESEDIAPIIDSLSQTLPQVLF